MKENSKVSNRRTKEIKSALIKIYILDLKLTVVLEEVNSQEDKNKELPLQEL